MSGEATSKLIASIDKLLRITFTGHVLFLGLCSQIIKSERFKIPYSNGKNKSFII